MMENVIQLEFQEVPPSQAVQERVANAVANVSSKLTSLLWKHRPAIYDSVIRDVVQKLKLDYNGFESLPEGLNVQAVFPSLF